MGAATPSDLIIPSWQSAETARLAPYAMPSACSRGRIQEEALDPFMGPFAIDRMRIVHSRAFRRLAYKTQVFVNEQGDLQRSRLTHTMEVVQQARRGALALGLNEDLVECIALVHDLGHPPFGHRGENTLNDLMQDAGGYEHNAHALAIVDQLEHSLAPQIGLNLSYEVRESIVKHGDHYVPDEFFPNEAPLLEAQLVDEVDSIAYDCHDIDDALRARIIHLQDLQQLQLWRGAWQEAVAANPRHTKKKVLIDHTVRILQDAFLSDLIEHSKRQMRRYAIVDQSSVRACTEPVIGMSSSMSAPKKELEQWLFTQVYRDYRVNRMFYKAAHILERLFHFYCSHADALPQEHAQRVQVVGIARTVADYLAGMTDRYAQEDYRRLFHPTHPSW